MRIVIATSGATSKLSGVNILLVQLSSELKKLGHTILLIGSFYDNPDFWEKLKGLKIPMLNLKLQGTLNWPLKSLYNILKTFSPDVVSTHDRNIDIKFAPITSLISTPQVATLHGLLSSFKEIMLYRRHFNSLRNFLWFKALKKCAKLVAISEAVRQDVISILGISPDQIITIQNAIDTNKFHPIAEPEAARRLLMPQLPSKFTMVLAGRLFKEKRPEQLINLVSILHDRGINCQGIYAGIGPDESSLRELGRLKGLNNIIFLGLQINMEKVYNCSDILVHFHENEGFGLAVAEALSCARPVIAVNKAALSELVDEGKTGYLFPPDRLDLMADKIAEIYSDKAEWQRLSKNARMIAEKRLGLARLISDYEQVFKEVSGFSNTKKFGT